MLFPRKANAPKNGDAPTEKAEAGKQITYDGKVKENKTHFPIDNKAAFVEGKISDYPSEEKAYRKLRDSRSDARLVGKREKRAKAKEEEKEKK